MRKKLILGTLLAATFSLPALAQYAPYMPDARNNTSSYIEASFDAVKIHLTSGAPIYDSAGNQIATLATFTDANEGYLVYESNAEGGSNVVRRLPAGSLTWNGEHLVTDVSFTGLSKLPSD